MLHSNFLADAAASTTAAECAKQRISRNPLPRVAEHLRSQFRQPLWLDGAHLPHVEPAAGPARCAVKDQPLRRHAVQHRRGVCAQPDALAACGSTADMLAGGCCSCNPHDVQRSPEQLS